MSTKDLPSLVNFEEIRKCLSQERLAALKVNPEFGPDYLRSEPEALKAIDLIEDIQTQLINFLKKFPTLVNVFENHFGPLVQFLSRQNVLDLALADHMIFPDKELLLFANSNEENPVGAIDEKLSKQSKDDFSKWCEEAQENHLKTSALVKENFDIDIKVSELKCQCVSCIADYRTKVRETLFNDCLGLIEKSRQEIEEGLDDEMDGGDLFYRMQKQLDQLLYKAKHRLKRSSLNKLEQQVKHKIKEYFNYPSVLGKKQLDVLRPFFTQLLRKDGLRPDLLSEQEISKFFSMLGSNIWRNERYLEKEFKKHIKSVLILKRKDISATILKEYLGEFWAHSQARKITRMITYHKGPTNSGKTYHAINGLAKAKSGCYLAPLRLLAGELYDTLNSKGVKTTLLTGEEVVETPDATHFSSTIEMARFHQEFESCVIDEIQMITDSQRGWAWTRALVNMQCKEIHICGDGSVLDLIKEIVELCGDQLEIKDYQRMTELVVDKKPVVVGELQRSDALIVFSRRNALKYKFDLEKLGFKVSVVYGRLGPEVRREQARKFDVGETDVIVSTDAIAMGMNLPIQRIIFSTLVKNIDGQEYPISTSEIKQIAGRAGRYGRYPVGHVTCLSKVKEGLKDVQDALGAVLEQQTQCMVGPDLDIFNQVNNALKANSLPVLKLSEFLRLFNTMTFKKPFFCVELKEMIELAEMVEDADPKGLLSSSEIFGFACAPVNLGLIEHVQYFVWILNQYVNSLAIPYSPIEATSTDIDYLETSIKCVELYQWLSRHFNNKNFDYDEYELTFNKQKAIDKLNELLSEKIVPSCSSCGLPLEEQSKFAICEVCFKNRRFHRRGRYQGPRQDNWKKGPQTSYEPASPDKVQEGEIREFTGPEGQSAPYKFPKTGSSDKNRKKGGQRFKKFDRDNKSSKNHNRNKRKKHAR